MVGHAWPRSAEGPAQSPSPDPGRETHEAEAVSTASEGRVWTVLERQQTPGKTLCSSSQLQYPHVSVLSAQANGVLLKNAG